RHPDIQLGQLYRRGVARAFNDTNTQTVIAWATADHKLPVVNGCMMRHQFDQAMIIGFAFRHLPRKINFVAGFYHRFYISGSSNNTQIESWSPLSISQFGSVGAADLFVTTTGK